MAYGSSEAPVPFYRPEAPVIPQVHPMPQGDLLGGNLIAAFTQRAIAAERTRIEQQQFLQNADLAAKHLELEKVKNSNDYELRKILYGSYTTNAEANRINAEARLRKTVSDVQDANDTQTQYINLTNDAKARAKEMHLDDPNRMTYDPVGFAADLQRFNDEFGLAPDDTGIPARIKAWQTKADQQTVPLKFGAKQDPDDPSKLIGGETIQVPIWKIARGLQDPGEYQLYKDALIASGHITQEEIETPAPDSRNIFTKFFAKKPEPIRTKQEKYDPFAADVFGKAKAVDFSPSKSRVPTFVPKTRVQKMGADVYDERTTPAGRASPQSVEDAANELNNEAPLPEPDLPPTTSAIPASALEPTSTDQTIAKAKLALSRGASPAAIADRLRKMNIDPSTLFA